MNVLVDIIKGIIVGIANIVPGLSGGTLMISMGVYEKAIGCVNNLFKDMKKSILTALPLVIGIGIGIVAFSFIIPWCLEEYPLPTCFCFIGLIMGSIPSLTKPAKESFVKDGTSISVPHIISFVALFISVIATAMVGEKQTIEASFELTLGFMIIMFIIGLIAAATMVIPGVSGSLILMILGYYEGIMNCISGCIKSLLVWDWASIFYYVGVLAPFGIGVVVGIFLVAKLMEILFEKCASITYSGIFGLIIATPIGILMKMGHNNINVVTIIVGIVLLVASTWFTYWFAKKTEGLE